jgi:NUC153 domain-containing protein
VKLDKRFAPLLKDDDFTKKAKVDRYGRKVKGEQSRKKLERLYELPSSSGEDESADEELGSGEDDDVVRKQLKKVEKKYDPARDGGFSTSESEEESESEVESEVDGELPEETETVPMGEVSRRLAVVNLDWDNIRALDIFAVASSFGKAEGAVVEVTVYPSEFGRERMEREDIEGPPREIFAGKPQKTGTDGISSDQEETDDSEEEETKVKRAILQSDDGAEFDSAALRKYQLDRLRFYYAVITCSSKDVAKALYDNMDGQEYLSSANFFDLRFIPDDVKFDERPRDSCKSLPADYQPVEFTTDALMHSRVKLTWDAEDTKRKEVQKKAFSRAEMNENDLLAYIGSNSSSSEFESEDEELPVDDANEDALSTVSRVTSRQAKRDALRAALGLDLETLPTSGTKDRNSRPVGDMQITFTPALSSKKNGESVFENDPIPRDETTAEKYARKEKERKMKRKERAKAKRLGTDVTDQGPERAAEEDQLMEHGSEDDGFNDPFFDNPQAAINDAKKAKKAQKVRFAAQDAAKDDNDARRAELELLMMDENNNETSPKNKMQRLDKPTNKKKKKRKGKTAEDEATAPEDVDVNVNDPRLSSLYTDPDFAIDPTSHLFKDTKGTRAILDEKRRRGEKRELARTKAPGEVEDLVQKVKKKAKR